MTQLHRRTTNIQKTVTLSDVGLKIESRRLQPWIEFIVDLRISTDRIRNGDQSRSLLEEQQAEEKRRQ